MFQILLIVFLVSVVFAGDDINICLDRIVGGSSLIDVRVPPGTNDIFIAQKPGRIYKVENGRLTTVVDFQSKVRNQGEMGFLSMAFHPKFTSENRRKVYTLYNSASNGDSIISQWDVATDGTISNEQIVLTQDQPYGNHDGGWVGFSPLDGYLYIALGDGGSSNDAAGAGQNPQTLLAKVARIDIDRQSGGKLYAVPADNPYIGQSKDGKAYLPEIFSDGWRNPFRCEFSGLESQLLYCADVGQNAWESITVIDTVKAVQQKGWNAGWPVFEGFRCNPDAKKIDVTTAVCNRERPQYKFPIFQYRNRGGASVMGGPVYRGNNDRRLTNRYLFSDFRRCVSWNGRRYETSECNAINLMAMDPNPDSEGLPHSCQPCALEGASGSQEPAWAHRLLIQLTPNSGTWRGQVWSFGEDGSGEAFVLNPAGLYRIAQPSACNIVTQAVAPVPTPPAPTPKMPTPAPTPAPPREPLVQPDVLCAAPATEVDELSSLVVELTVDAHRINNEAFSVTTRAFNGQVPGPTIAVPRGTRLQIKLTNKLGTESAASRQGAGNNGGPAYDAENTYKHPNTTNIHVHGLHVSPSGNADNVARECAPGETLMYEYVIDHDHPAGVFWYHAHLHGSSALQIDGGLAGAIVVLDDPASLEAGLSSMTEHVLMMQQIGLEGSEEKGNVLALASSSRSTLPQNAANNLKQPRYYLVNGQYRPELRLARNEPRRLRMVNAGGSHFLHMGVEAECAFTLIAMDGIYLDAPLATKRVVIPPGGRADVVLQCSSAGLFTLLSEALDSAQSHLSNAAIFEGSVMHFRVSSTAYSGAARVPSTLPARPAYLQVSAGGAPQVISASQLTAVAGYAMDEDRLKGVAGMVNVATYTFALTPGTYSLAMRPVLEHDGQPTYRVLINGQLAHTYKASLGNNGMGFDDTHVESVVTSRVFAAGDVVRIEGDADAGAFARLKELIFRPAGQATTERIEFGSAEMTINGKRYTKDAVFSTLDLDSEYEWIVSSSDSQNHPFHQHVNHFYVAGFDRPAANALERSGVVVGMWRDTVPVSDVNPITIRFKPHRYTGKMVFHCHVSAHADLGMVTSSELSDPNNVASQHAASFPSNSAALAKSASEGGVCAGVAKQPKAPSTSVCGNGVVERPAEECEPSQGGCCTAQCKFVAAGQMCRAAQAAATCDLPDTCSGDSAICADKVKVKGTECVPAEGTCKPAAVCDGSRGLCPKPTIDIGAMCDDGNECTKPDVCNLYGECSGINTCSCATDMECDTDKDPCTEDKCVDGKCVRSAAEAGRLCDDRDMCTANDRCTESGVCVGESKCADDCNAPNGRCCANACVCEATFTGPTCSEPNEGCPLGTEGCECLDGTGCQADLWCPAGKCERPTTAAAHHVMALATALAALVLML